MPDSGRTLRFAARAERIAAGEGIEARFSCDVLAFEWVPPAEDKTPARGTTCAASVCADGPPKQDGIAPGRASRSTTSSPTAASPSAGIRRMRVFGPRDAELK